MTAPARTRNNDGGNNGNGRHSSGTLSLLPSSMLEAYNDLASDVRRIYRTDLPGVLRRRAKKARLMASLLEEIARVREQEVAS